MGGRKVGPYQLSVDMGFDMIGRRYGHIGVGFVKESSTLKLDKIEGEERRHRTRSITNEKHEKARMRGAL